MQVGQGVGALLRAQVRGDMMMVPSAVNRLQKLPSARRKSRLWLMVAVLGTAAAARGQHKESALLSGYPYTAAFLSTISTLLVARSCLYFQFAEEHSRFPSGRRAGGFRYSLDGSTL